MISLWPSVRGKGEEFGEQCELLTNNCKANDTRIDQTLRKLGIDRNAFNYYRRLYRDKLAREFIFPVVIVEVAETAGLDQHRWSCACFDRGL
jgi:hypothetical protein